MPGVHACISYVCTPFMVRLIFTNNFLNYICMEIAGVSVVLSHLILGFYLHVS